MIFVTHAKAGSTWIDRILRAIYGKQVAPRLYDIPPSLSFEKHHIYSAIFINRAEYLQHPELFGIHRFAVVRDLRDTLVSQYFSTRDTHVEDPAGRIAARRKILLESSEEDGLIYLIDQAFHRHAGIQESWVGTETPIFRYEELLQNDVAIFTDLLVNRFGHAISKSRIEDAVSANRFETVFGRKLGVQDAKSHGRRGLPGDWKNHFTPRVAERFLERFGHVLIATGYEKDARWVEAFARPAADNGKNEDHPAGSTLHKP